jgi:hypothetical protein
MKRTQISTKSTFERIEKVIKRIGQGAFAMLGNTVRLGKKRTRLRFG